MNNIYKYLVLISVILVVVFQVNIVNATGTGSISGTVYLDSTCNGYDLSDKPLQGVEALLKLENSKLHYKLKSDSNGNLIFFNLPYGKYSLLLDAGKKYTPDKLFVQYEIGEANGAVSGTFVFCKK